MQREEMSSWLALLYFLADLRHGYASCCVPVTHSVLYALTRSVSMTRFVRVRVPLRDCNAYAFSCSAYSTSRISRVLTAYAVPIITSSPIRRVHTDFPTSRIFLARFLLNAFIRYSISVLLLSEFLLSSTLFT